MRAQLVEHADDAVVAAKNDEILTQQTRPPRRTARFQLVAERGGNPVPPKHPPHRRVGTDPAQLFVLFTCQHRAILFGVLRHTAVL